jgi:hypothetical protein
MLFIIGILAPATVERSETLGLAVYVGVHLGGLVFRYGAVLLQDGNREVK